MNRFSLFIVLMVILLVQTTVRAFPVSSEFGIRKHPISGEEHSYHTGIDIPAEYGDLITAVFDGEVIFADEWGGYGNAILLFHGNDIYTLYGHCQKLYVDPGQSVQAGKIIAVVGSTGNSTGPHLHLEYWVQGQYVDPMEIWR